MGECSTTTAPVKGRAGKVFQKEEGRQLHVHRMESKPFIARTLFRKEQTEETGLPDIQSLFESGIHFFSGVSSVQSKCESCEIEPFVQRKQIETSTTDESSIGRLHIHRAEEEIQTKCEACEKEESKSSDEHVPALCKECSHDGEIQRSYNGETKGSETATKADTHNVSKRATHTPALPVVQPALKVGKPDDPFEQEADRMAERVMKMPLRSFTGGGAIGREGNGNSVQRQEDESADEVQAKLTPGLQRSAEGGMQTTPTFGARLGSAGSGAPMSSPVKHDMETAFQADFSAVKIHTGTEAASLSSEIGAQAFTHQNDIYFNDNKYQPESSDGRFLLAHELTHTVQQGAATTLQRDPEEDKPKEQSWWDKFKDSVESGLRMILPTALFDFYLKIKNGGILNYIKETLLGLFMDLFRGLGFSDDEIMTVIRVFVMIKAQLPKIVDDLSKGDCNSLFAALNVLQQLLSEIAGRVWDNLMEAIEPIRQWLLKIWNTYLSPALDKITAFAGEVWENLKRLGRWIWDKFYTYVIKPWKDAWEWMCKKLGFGDSDEPGLMDCVSKKLGEAWAYIKQELRPITEPIGQVVDFIKSLINMEAIRKFQEDAKKWLDEVAKTATAMGEDDDAVANKQVTLREVLLPALNKAIDKLKNTIRAAGSWLTNQVNGIAEKVNGFVTGINQNSFLRPLYSLISWVPKTVNTIQDWAVDKVNGVFDWLVTGVERLRAFIEPVFNMLQRIVGVLGDLVNKISDFILGPLKKVPKCIVDPIVKWFTEMILKKIPIISEFISLTEKWDQIKMAAITVLKQVFLEGQMLKGLWTFFKTLLGIVGIDPKLVTTIVAKAAKNFSDIISKPLDFLKNVWGVIKGGFKLFWDNITTHLPAGALKWLFGKVKGAVAVAPPKDFSLGSILGYVLDLFGITKENVYKRMELNPRIGPERVKKLRELEKALTGALEWITVWINEGAEGLLRKAKEKMAEIKDVIINGVISWVGKKISAEIMKRLATSSDPLGIGATINTIIVVYDSIHAAIDYANEILDMINQAMDDLAEIIGGNLKPASEAFEKLLAAGVPVVIGFAVKVILGDVGDSIKEIVLDARKVVDSAIDGLINGALSIIDSVINAGKKAAGKVLGWLGLKKNFTADNGEDHELSFSGSSESAILTIASRPQPLATWINGIKIDNPNTTQGKKLTQKKHDAKAKAAEIDRVKKDKNLDDSEKEKQVRQLLDELSGLIGPLFGGKLEDCASEENELLKFGSKHGGSYGSRMHANGLTKINMPVGSVPNTSDPSYEIINQRRSGNGSYYVLGHLLNHNLGGTGNDMKNLTPLTRSANSRHHNLVENNIKTAVQKGNSVEYKVIPKYTSRPTASAISDVKNSDIGDKETVIKIIKEETKVPVSLTCIANFKDPEGKDRGTLLNEQVDNEIDQRPEAYDLVGMKRSEVYLDSGSKTKIKSIGSEVTDELASKIISAMRSREVRTYDGLATYKNKGQDQFDKDEKKIIRNFGTKDYEFVKLYKVEK